MGQGVLMAISKSIIRPLALGPLPSCLSTPLWNFPHPGLISTFMDALDRVWGWTQMYRKRSLPVCPLIPSLLEGSSSFLMLLSWYLGLKGTGVGKHSGSGCGWRGQVVSSSCHHLLSRWAQTLSSSHLFPEIMPCVSSVYLGKEEEERTSSRGDQW